MTRTVRTTMRPDQPVEVDDAEYTDLQRQGLLTEDADPPSVPATAVKRTATPAATTKEG